MPSVSFGRIHQALRVTPAMEAVRSRKSVRRLIVILRLVATILALILAVVLWSGMARLSWKSDAGLAVLAALVWAYAFERNVP
jgi:hypothetical protein